MKDLFALFRLMLRLRRKSMLQGAVLTIVVLIAGVGLLGLSGWFITAAAAAGLAGVGATFDVFRPSAGVRMLALGRTVARYGERLTTHDATLRVLSAFRVQLLNGILGSEFSEQVKLRGAQALNRLVADVDALDNIPLRLILPVAAAISTTLITFLMLWWLTDFWIALPITFGMITGGLLVSFIGMLRSLSHSAAEEETGQSLRAHLVDVIRSRDDLIIYGQIETQKIRLLEQLNEFHFHRRKIDKIDRQTGAFLSVLLTVLTTYALWAGYWFAIEGVFSPALSALGIFATLGLFEAIAPLRRSATEMGRMVVAAARVRPNLIQKAPLASVQDLRIEVVTPLFQAHAGESIALVGPSGSGKSTLLNQIAGLIPTETVTVGGMPPAFIDEVELRNIVGFVPQRIRLFSGTLRENLSLGVENVSDQELKKVLQLLKLGTLLQERDALDLKLDIHASGLSGGQARRVALGRALLRKPKILLLDEPTEGLDQSMSLEIMQNIRDYLPDSLIIYATHSAEEAQWAHRIVKIQEN